jgi:ribonucleoside-diphosphate reductase alpha chain
MATQLAASQASGDARARLALRRYFTTPGTHPYDEVAWERRSASIQAEGGQAVFEQNDLDFPKDWSQLATNVVASKYFRGQLGSPRRESSVRQLIDRVVLTLRQWGDEEGYFADPTEGDTFEAELTHLLVQQKMAFNSPVWFNMGTRENPQSSACFILSVDDTMDSILSWIGKEGVIFKGGSGSGINLSRIRSSREALSGGGTASGPVSFMRGADSCAGAIKSGGTTRRAAKMVILNADHPDIRDFIACKANEEKKAWALGEMGYDMGLNGEAWQSIQFQNANNSVRVTDEFMLAVEANEEWTTNAVTTGEVMDTFKARSLMREIAEAAWVCGDPGMQYDSTINRWHTCPNSGRINGSNPCFPADARVHTTLGLVPIGDLYERAQFGEDFRVYTHRVTAESPGEGVVATEPLAIMRTGVKSIVRLRFSNGQELRCTPNHRVWTTNRGYVRAEDLSADDRVMINDSPTPSVDATWELPVTVEAEARSASRGGTVTRQRLPERWSEGLGELLGHLIGDGWLTDVQTGWVYGGDDIDDGLAASHEGLVRELVGGVSRQEMSNGTVQLRVGSEAVRELFRGLGVTTARAHEKRVPASVFTAPPEIQAAFLRGLFGADGCVSDVEGGEASRYVGLGSRSDRLLRDVQRLLTSFGVRSRIYDINGSNSTRFSYQRADGDVVEYESRPGFDLRITGSDLERFAEQIGFSTPRKESQLNGLLERSIRYATKAGTALVSREADGQEWVYNLSEPLHHSYIVDGVVVANCSEYMHIDNSACNLASLNLMKFVDEAGTFLVDDFRQAVDVTIAAMDIIVSRSGYPTAEIGENAQKFRQLGLGYANLGALLMSHGLAYDSDTGRAYAGAVTALMTGRAYEMSTRLAERMGPFEGYAVNAAPMQGVMRMHQKAVEDIAEHLVPDPTLLEAAREAWRNVVDRGAVHGIRNSQASVLAPTGTIGFMMDCDTTGVEPDIALVKYKRLVGGGVIKLVNNTVPRALRTLGYTDAEIDAIVSFVDAHETIEGAPGLKQEDLPVFDCAFTPLNGTRSIAASGHIKMMGAVQPFISGAISKTVNMPTEATPEEIAGAYQLAWKEGVKALAIYRDGSKRTQPLSTGNKLPEPTQAARPTRRRMPDEREAITHHFSIADHDGYITVGKYEDGSPGEVFMKMAKQGSTVAGLMDSLAICMSLALQHGVPLQVMADKLSHMRFEPSGFTGNSEIPIAKSIVDYVVRWLSSKFLSEDEKRQVGIITEQLRAEAKVLAETETLLDGDGDDSTDGPSGTVIALPTAQSAAAPAVPEAAASTPGQTAIPLSPAQGGAYTFRMQTDGAICSSCGWTMIRSGSCYKCENCGSTSGCS